VYYDVCAKELYKWALETIAAIALGTTTILANLPRTLKKITKTKA
jgi:hypothetical protein